MAAYIWAKVAVTTVRAIDVCGGAGGWAVAARGLPIEIVAAFDREDDCLATYKLNHPSVETIKCDVMQMDFSRWRGIDLILGGIPCETISVARNNRERSSAEMKGFKRLLERFLSLRDELAARWFCYEEVMQVVPLLPKHTPFFKLNSKSFSAQARTRVFIGNLPCPPAGDCTAVLADFLLPGPHRISHRIHGKRTPSRTGKCSTTFQPFPPEKKSFTVTNFADSRRDAECATSHPLGWRNIDWRECAKLQGFPSDYLFVGNPGRVSKMVSQAVQIDTARAILQGIFPL